MDQQERLALVVRVFTAWERAQLEAFSDAMDALYTATGGHELVSARALDLALARRTPAAHAGAGQEQLDELAAASLLAIIDWVGCDEETFTRALDEAIAAR